MGFRDLIRLFLSQDEKIVIPINDDEIDEHSCELKLHSDNMTELKELVDKLPSTPDGPAPEFKLERNVI